MRTVVINSTNYDVGTGNSYTYRLPSAVSFGRGDEVALAGLSIYNSTFNVTAARGNNTFTITWQALNALLLKANTITFTIPDGFYTITQLNAFIQLQMFNQGWYLVNAAGQPVYFISLVTNDSVYGTQIRVSEIPTSTQATNLGLSAPKTTAYSNATYPITVGAVANTAVNFAVPSIAFGAGFGALFGFPATPTAGLTAILTPSASFNAANNYNTTIYNSSLTPVIAPINSYIMTLNLINSPYTVPSGVFFTVPLSVSLGQVIIVNPSQFLFNDIAPNIYNSINVRFFDQNFNAITLNDTQLTITLAIREAGKD